MSLSSRRLVFWITAFAAVGVWLLLPTPASPIPAPLESTPWIALPASGMDASQSRVRDVVAGLRNDDLEADCGRRDRAVHAQYRILVSPSDRGSARQIDIVPSGDWLDVSIRESSPVPATDSRGSGSWVAPVTRLRVRPQAMEPIRRIWLTHAMWDAPQGEASCLYGQRLVLEACIEGRWAARDRNCDDAADSGALWQAVSTLLPTPRPGAFQSR